MMKKITLFAAILTLGFTACVEDKPFEGPAAISNIAYTPANVTPNDDVTVTATITDLQGVTSAKLQYKVGNGNYTVVNMTADKSTYTGIIPKQADKAEVRFYIEVENETGFTAKSPEKTYIVGTEAILIYINECDPDSKQFEIYNAGNEEVDIAGFRFLKDEKDEWIVPAGKGNIPSKGYLVYTAKNDGIEGPEFGMSGSKGFKIELFDKNGVSVSVVDNLTDIKPIAAGETYGRKTDGANEWVIFYPGSIGSSNATGKIK